MKELVRCPVCSSPMLEEDFGSARVNVCSQGCGRERPPAPSELQAFARRIRARQGRRQRAERAEQRGLTIGLLIGMLISG